MRIWLLGDSDWQALCCDKRGLLFPASSAPEVTCLPLCLFCPELWAVPKMKLLPSGLSISRPARLGHQLIVARLEKCLMGGHTLRWGRGVPSRAEIASESRVGLFLRLVR